ncbi:MAG: hypothetical protein AAGJ91_13950 [Pseudomonadota bacterium]
MPRRTYVNAVLGPLAALTLASCAAVNPAGLIAASRLDPLATAPGDIALAVGVPDRVGLVDGDAEFRMSYRREGGDGAVLVDETVALQLRRVAAGAPPKRSAGETVFAARFSEEGAARIAAAQSEIRSLRRQGVDGTGSLTVSVIGGCVLGPPLRELPVSTWIQTNPTNGFVRLTRSRDLFAALDAPAAADLQRRLKPCGT